MPAIQVKLREQQNNSHKIIVEEGCSGKLPEYLKHTIKADKYAIITDSKVAKIYGKSLQKYLQKKGLKCMLFSFPQGEKSKNIHTVEKLAIEMVEKGFTRKDAVITLGGGVVGDTAGFLASVYMRGIPYIQIPTTLLAMVDSSIGGKTGVDLSLGKNLLGTFYQPKLVLIDPKYLKTLTQNQIHNGLAEIIKYGVIKDKNLFTFIEQNLDKIFALNKAVLKRIITRSIEIKTEVVERDEKESKLRMILNYGHTYGHAIEKMSGYRLLHGYTISIGMVIANTIAVEKKLLKPAAAERIKNLLKKAGLPVTTTKVPNTKDLLSDKKRVGKILNLVLPTSIGTVIIHQEKCL